jgi:hypothetical protein
MEEVTLHFRDKVFEKLINDADQVLQKLLSNMTEKGSTIGRLTISLDCIFEEETVMDKNSTDGFFSRVIHTPKFQHKVGSVLQIKNEQKGDVNCDGMEMVYDEKTKEYILCPITGREQMSFYDIGYSDDLPKLPVTFEK